MHEFEIEQTERVYQLIHHVFLRLAKWGIASDEITLLEFFEYLAELAIVCQPRSLQQILSGHALPPVLQGCDDGQMVVGLLESELNRRSNSSVSSPPRVKHSCWIFCATL